MTVLLEYFDLSISAGRAQLRFRGPSHTLGYTTEKQTLRLKTLLKFRGILLYNMPIMPALCPKLAYYASIMLDTLACLLCFKLCWHNRRRPSMHTYAHSIHRGTQTHNRHLISFAIKLPLWYAYLFVMRAGKIETYLFQYINCVIHATNFCDASNLSASPSYNSRTIPCKN